MELSWIRPRNFLPGLTSSCYASESGRKYDPFFIPYLYLGTNLYCGAAEYTRCTWAEGTLVRSGGICVVPCYGTRLRGFLSHDSLQYIILRRIVPGQKKPFATHLMRNTYATMQRSGFDPYHGLRCNNTQNKHIDVITMPWAMTDVLGLVKIGQAHE